MNRISNLLDNMNENMMAKKIKGYWFLPVFIIASSILFFMVYKILATDVFFFLNNFYWCFFTIIGLMTVCSLLTYLYAYRYKLPVLKKSVLISFIYTIILVLIFIYPDLKRLIH